MHTLVYYTMRLFEQDSPRRWLQSHDSRRRSFTHPGEDKGKDRRIEMVIGIGRGNGNDSLERQSLHAHRLFSDHVRQRTPKVPNCIANVDSGRSQGTATAIYIKITSVYVGLAWLGVQLSLILECRPFKQYWAVPTEDRMSTCIARRVAY